MIWCNFTTNSCAYEFSSVFWWWILISHQVFIGMLDVMMVLIILQIVWFPGQESSPNTCWYAWKCFRYNIFLKLNWWTTYLQCVVVKKLFPLKEMLTLTSSQNFNIFLTLWNKLYKFNHTKNAKFRTICDVFTKLYFLETAKNCACISFQGSKMRKEWHQKDHTNRFAIGELNRFFIKR